MPTIAVANPTPRTGKTTTAISLASFWGAFGAKTLLVDLDPKADASDALYRAITVSLDQVLGQGLPFRSAIAPSRVTRVDLVRASRNLSPVEDQVGGGSDNAVRSGIGEARSKYSYTILDCASSSGAMTQEALSIADAVLVPLACDEGSAAEISGSLRELGRIRSDVNPHLRVLLVATMAGAMGSRQTIAELRQVYPRLTLEAAIPVDQQLTRVLGGKPILTQASRGARAYEQLAIELASRAVGFS